MCITCILIPLLTGIVAALLGYLLGKKSNSNNASGLALTTQFENLKRERDALLSKNSDLNSRLTAMGSVSTSEVELRANISALEAETEKLKQLLSDCENNAHKSDSEDWKAKFDKLTNEFTTHKAGADNRIASLTGEIDALRLANVTVEPEDLKIIEGIGPKIEELLNRNKIFTFKQLSNTAVDALTDILTSAGPNYKIHDPSTWPRQAQLAHEGKWDELKTWQAELQGGK